MLIIYHIWELIIEVRHCTGIRRKGGGGTTLGSVLAVLLGVLSCSCAAGSQLAAPATGASPSFSRGLLAYQAGGKRC